MQHCLPGAEAGWSAERTPLVSVFAALESARHLRRQVEDAATAVDEDHAHLRNELAMLRHWVQVAGSESDEYSALVDGLGDYADRVEDVLDDLARSET